MLPHHLCRVLAVKSWIPLGPRTGHPRAAWELYISQEDAPLVSLNSNDSLLPFASFPSLPLEYNVHTPAAKDLQAEVSPSV